jgi:hypothetical protein
VNVIGTDTYRAYGDQQEEYSAWIGKPWRRLEYLRQRSFWKGECVNTDRTWSATLGLLRLGWHFHLTITRSVSADYSDEPNQ